MTYTPAVDSKGSAGAPEDEIEITPEMIEAGAIALSGYDAYLSNAECGAKEIFSAMILAAPAAKRKALAFSGEVAGS
jgi:hypothetical protein